MGSRVKEMEAFIKYNAKLFHQNPDIKINSDILYDMLMKYDMSIVEQKDRLANDNLEYWQTAFSNVENIKTFTTPKNTGFIHFENIKVINDINFFKLYLTFGKDDMKDCVEQIIRFMAQENITHGSKAANKQRSDALVLRVEKLEGVEKIQKFIHSNPSISSKLRKPNPFVYNKDGIGYAMDGRVIFNGTLADQLSDYYNDLKMNKKLKKASLMGFRNHLIRTYNSTFVSCENLENFMNTDVFKKCIVDKNEPERTVNNYLEVFKLMILSTDISDNFNDYIDHYNFCHDDVRVTGNCNFFKQKILAMQKEVPKTEISETPKEIELRSDIFDAYITYGIEKYGINDVINILEEYAKSGNVTNITRDKNFRTLFENYVSKDAINQILSGVTMRAYCSKFRKIDKVELLDNAAYATCSKHGVEQLKNAINSSILFGNFSFFSENGKNMSRTKLMENVSKEELSIIIKESLVRKGIVLTEDDIYFNCYTNYIANTIADLENSEKVI